MWLKYGLGFSAIWLAGVTAAIAQTQVQDTIWMHVRQNGSVLYTNEPSSAKAQGSTVIDAVAPPKAPEVSATPKEALAKEPLKALLPKDASLQTSAPKEKVISNPAAALGDWPPRGLFTTK